MVTVLRLGKRPSRDHRINTHLALVARAFGAEKLIMFFEDKTLLESVSDINKRFGGNFSVEIIRNGGWKHLVKNWQGIVIHLTMYGMRMDNGLKRINEISHDKGKDILLVIGGEKVPSAVYGAADLNISIGNQPHSEVAALAVFLNNYFHGNELYREMNDWKLKVIPKSKGKSMEKKD